MTFYEVLAQVLELLQREKRVSYRALKRQFALDDDYLEDVKTEIIKAKKLAVDEEGEILVWIEKSEEPPYPHKHDQSPLIYTPAHLAEKILHSRAALEGERKQVTVLFADIKGSTELIAGLDPEEARQILDPVLHTMMEAVHRYEGTVNQVLGDGIMALFGAPLAHEDHAVRACYAALAMQEAMRRHTETIRRTHGVEVQIRVGLNSGEVVVRAIGNDLHMDYSAIGQTTHLAARMEQLASPGSIRLTGDTLRLVEGLVQVTSLGPMPVKGMSEPVEVFELVGVSGVRRRLQATTVRELTRFVGRQAELEMLSQALDQTEAGQGQVVAVVGEAGVGKSRLFYEYIHALHTDRCLVLESSAVSYGKTTPYLPVINLLKAYFQLEDRDHEREIEEKVTRKLFTRDSTLQQAQGAFLTLFNVSVEDLHWQHLDPSQRRQCLLDACKHLLLQESQIQPLLLVFENLHWIDSETQEFLDRLIERLPTARILLLVNYRPEYQHGWGSKTCYRQIRLDPLSGEGAAALLRALLGEDPSLEPLKQLLIERTEGNPFFLEETIHALYEQGVLRRKAGKTVVSPLLTQSLTPIHLPATVQAVLAARIDRLPLEDKHLLQTAAVIGKDVPLALLQTIADVPDASIHRSLTHLQTAEFLYETRLFPDREYTFKHALTHQVAYESLLQARRQMLHSRIVEAIETLYTNRLSDQIEWLAYHALRGEDWEKAFSYCQQAGGKAVARSVFREAVPYFEQALVALEHLPESRERSEQAIDLRFDLYNALTPLGAHEQVLTYLREAEALAVSLGDQYRLGWVLTYMVGHFWMIGDQDRAIAFSQRALALMERVDDFSFQTYVNLWLGLIYYSLSDYGQAMDFFKKVVTLLSGELVHERFGMHILRSVSSRVYLARCLTEVGAFADALRYGEEAIQIAESAEHTNSRIGAYLSMGILSLYKGDCHEAIPTFERCLQLSQQWNITLWFSQTVSSLGSAYVLAGRISEGLHLLEQIVEQTAAQKGVGHSFRLVRLSEAYLLAGHSEEALTQALQALDLSREHKECGYQAYAFRLLGEIYASHDPPAVDEAEEFYQQALMLATELEMRPLQAHCHRGLGMLYAKTGLREKAHAALATASEMYQSMEMAFWLPQTKEALAQVDSDEL